MLATMPETMAKIIVARMAPAILFHSNDDILVPRTVRAAVGSAAGEKPIFADNSNEMCLKRRAGERPSVSRRWVLCGITPQHLADRPAGERKIHGGTCQQVAPHRHH